MDTVSMIKDILSQQLDMDMESMDPDTKLSDLDIDSLDLVEIIMAVEDEFNITIEEEEANGIDDLDSLVTLVESKSKEE